MAELAGLAAGESSSPYRGIRPFGYVDRGLFFGRQAAIDDLFAKILVSRLVLLFGDSQTGKSSLINAGLVPALEREGLRTELLRVRPIPEEPVLVERILRGDSPQQGFLPSIFVRQESSAAKTVACSLTDLSETLRERAADARPVLIFDQFEELFTLFARDPTFGRDPTEVERRDRELELKDQILDAILGIVGDQNLRAKIVLIIREDYLGKLDVLTKGYPRVFDYRVQLGLLEAGAATKAILGPVQDASPGHPRLNEQLANTIIADLTRADARAGIRSTELQIVCERLWDQYAAETEDIGVDEYRRLGGVKGILESFLQKRLETLGPNRTRAILILGHLVTDEDTRDVVGIGKLKRLVAQGSEAEEEAFLSTLQSLQRERLVNLTEQRKAACYELVSEYLIPAIKLELSKVERERATQRALADQARELDKRRERLKARMLWILAVLVLLSSGLALWAIREQRAANEEAERALVRLLTARSVLAKTPVVGTLLGLEALRQRPNGEAYAALRTNLGVLRPSIARLQESGPIGHASFGRDGTRMVTVTTDNTVRVWNAEGSGEPLLVLAGDGGSVRSAAYSPDGEQIVTVSTDGTVRVWNVDGTGEPLVLEDGGGSGKKAVYRPDGTQIATGSADGTARVWNADGSGEPLVLEGHEAPVKTVAYSSDGTRIVTGSEDGTARVWDAGGSGEPLVLEHEDSVLFAAFSPGGQQVVTATSQRFVRVWNTDGPPGQPSIIQRFGATILDVAFGPEGARIATGSGDPHVRVFQAGGSKESLFLDHQGLVLAAAFSLDGDRILTASGDGSVRVWQIRRSGEPLVLGGHTGGVASAAFDRSSDHIVTASADRTARVWPADGSAEPVTLRGHLQGVFSAVFSPDGQQVLTTSADGSARVWNADGSGEAVVLQSPDGGDESYAGEPFSRKFVEADLREVLRFFSQVKKLDMLVSPNAGGTVTVEFDDTPWDQAVEQVLRTNGLGYELLGRILLVRPISPSWWNATFSPDGRQVLMPTANGTLQVWNADGSGAPDVLPGVVLEGTEDRIQPGITEYVGEPMSVSLKDANIKDVLRSFALISGLSIEVLPNVRGTVTAEFREVPWDQALAAILRVNNLGFRSEDGVIRVWPSLAPRSTVAFSRGGRRCATIGADGSVRVQSTDGSEDAVVLKGHEDPVYSVAFSDDGSRIVTASGDGTARVWNADGSGEPVVLRGHDGAVLSASFSPGGTHVVTGSEDTTARVWSSDGSGEPIVLQGHEGHVTSAAFSTDGDRVVTASEDGTARIWAWRIGDLIERACSIVPRNLTAEEWSRHFGDLPYRPTCPQLEAGPAR